MARMLYPIGIQSFSEIRERGYVYVDKTHYIHQLISSGKYVFLSRPRRFGKSLFLSTIEEFYKGRRDLFEGLAIMAEDYDWVAHPVLHLDLTGSNFTSADSLHIHLDRFLSRLEDRYGIPSINSDALGLRFSNVIEQIHSKSGQKVVILVDEYDKPLLESAGNQALQDKFRGDLRAFYSNLKSQDRHIEFAMLTGVTKFGQLSIFSDLNNLEDISMEAEYEGICGVSSDELHSYFHSGVEALASKRGMTVQETYTRLRLDYDGYRFSVDGKREIYNPFSLISTLKKGSFGDYWFQTGTPTFLVKMLREGRIPLKDMDDYQTGLSALTDISFDMDDPIPILFQSGYLTIKGYDPEFNLVTLGYPNREVQSGFLNQLMSMYTTVPGNNTTFEISRFIKDAREGKAQDFMLRLQSLFSDFSYDTFELRHLERHYQDVVYIVMKLMGFHTHTEYRTAAGRIDMTVLTERFIYLFEFKMDKTARAALDQINNKDYLLPFGADGRQIIKIGANFSNKLRTISDWIIENG